MIAITLLFGCQRALNVSPRTDRAASAVDLESDDLIQEETMSAAINSARNARSSAFSSVPSLKNLRRRGPRPRDAKHVVPFDELIAPHAQTIFRVAYRITRNREDAEDAMQDAFLRAFARFEDFDGRSKFSTWLTRIAINSSLMILRKRKTAQTVSLDAANDSGESQTFGEMKDPAPDAEQQYLQKEREATLRDAMNELRPSHKRAIELGYLGERSMRETAEIIGVSLGATKARLFHGRAALRKSRTLHRFRNDRHSRKSSHSAQVETGSNNTERG